MYDQTLFLGTTGPVTLTTEPQVGNTKFPEKANFPVRDQPFHQSM